MSGAHRLDAPGGPLCACGQPSRHESGWCGHCGHDDQMWKPNSAADVAENNPSMIAGQLRALQREVRSGFELITTKILGRLDHLDERLEVVIDRVAELEARQSRTEERLAALERR